MIDKLLLKRSVDLAVSEAGFQRKGSCWYLMDVDVIVLIALRKSDHGNYYYLDGGISLRAIADEQRPKLNQCHIQFSLNSLAADENRVFVKGLDLDSAEEGDISSLVALIKDRCLPSLLEIASISGLRRHYKKGGLKGALLFWQARQMLEAAE